MNEDERKKKIEVGRQKLAHFKKKKGRNSSVGVVSPPHLLHDAPNLVDQVLNNGKVMEGSECNKENEEHEPSVSEDHVALLMSEYSQKINKFQEALEERDRIIHQLSDRLASTLETQHTIQKEGIIQAETLAKEISMLQRQLQEASEVLSQQKSKNGISAQQLLDSRNQVIFLQDISHQKDIRIKGLSQKIASLEHQISDVAHELQVARISRETCDLGTETEESLWKAPEKEMKDVDILCKIPELHSVSEESDIISGEEENVSSDAINLSLPANDGACDLAERAFKSMSCTEMGVQVDTSELNSTMLVCPLSLETHSISRFLDEFTEDPNCSSRHVLFNSIVKLIEENQELQTYVNNFRTMDKSNSFLEFTENEECSSSTAIAAPDICKKSPNEVLKRLEYLNDITEVVESLLNIVKNDVSKSILWSPSKFQASILNSLHFDDSVVSKKLVSPDSRRHAVASDSGSSDHGASLVSSGSEPNSNTMLCQDLSVEILRRHNISSKLSCLREFIREELNTCISEASMFLGSIEDIADKKNAPENVLCSIENIPGDSSIGNSDSLVDNKEECAVHRDIILHKKNLESSLQHFKILEENLREDGNSTKKKDTGSEKFSECDLLSENLPFSCVSLLSFSDSDSKTDLGDLIWDVNLNEVEISSTAAEMSHPQESQPSASDLPPDMGSDISGRAQSTAVEDVNSDLADHKTSKDKLYDSHKEHSPDQSHKEQKSYESHMERQLFDSHETRERTSPDSLNLRQKRLILCDYEKLIQQLKEKYSSEVLNMKLNLENSYNVEKGQLENRIKELESLKIELEANEQKFTGILAEREVQCANHVSQIQSIINEHGQQIGDIQLKLDQCNVEKTGLLTKVKDLQEALMQANKQKAECLEAKAKVEYSLQNQIADLVQDHQQDIEIIKKEAFDALNQEKRRLEKDYQLTSEKMKSQYEEQLDDVKKSLQKCFEEEKQKVIEKQNQILIQKDAEHKEEINSYQKKVEALLEEKCSLLTKYQTDFENIMKNHHSILENLCFHFHSQISKAKCKMEKAENGDNCSSSADILNDLSQTFEDEVNSLLKENVLVNKNESSGAEGTLNVSFEDRYPNEEGIDWKKQVAKLLQEIDLLKGKYELEIDSLKQQIAPATEMAVLENFDSEQLQSMMIEEINKLQKDFEEEMELYKKANEQLADELELVRNKIYVLEEHNTKLQHQLKKKDESQDTSELNQLHLDNSSVRSSVNSPQISASEIRAWRVHAAQTNSRLLHVLSDIVKTFLDIEHDINRHLMQFGLISPNADMCAQHDDDTVQSIGSREDFTALSVGESPNLDLTEDGPDLTPRAWDLFNSVGTYDAEIEGEDVVIGASRRLRSAVDQVLYYLSRALENLQSHDLKALLKRNEELSQDLQEESHGKDALQVDLVNAESVIRKTEAEKQKLENANFQLLEEKEALAHKLALTKEKLKIVEEDKELAYEEQRQLMEQRDLLARGLGDPEQISAGNDKVRSHSDPLMHEESALLQENTKLSTEKRNIQKHLSKERQSLMARLHQLELSYDEVAAEKEEILERKKREVEDLKSQMEAMEKQLQSNRKFIEEQAQEREQEREEYLRELNKLEEIVREKERIQNNEDQLTKEVENLEQLLKAKIEDHKTVVNKKEDIENELRQSFDKIHDLRDIIGELEKQLDMKTRSEGELKKQFAELLESLSAQEKNVTDLPKEEEERFVVPSNRESLEQVRDLEEQLASRTQELEQLTQSQVLLQELRGQIHFLEAKVEQKTRQLETMHFSSLCASPVPSDDTSHSESHDSELHVHAEDPWGEMSPRSLHWLEIRRLEEKIGRLVHIEEELIKRNKDLDSQLRKLKIAEEEHRHEKAALQEQATEQLLQLSALKSRIEEQRHRTTLPTNAEFITELEDLRESLNREQEQRKMTEADLSEVKKRLDTVKEELERKNMLINQLKVDIQKAEDEKQHSSSGAKPQKPECEIQLQDESDSECVPHFIKLLIQEKNEHIDSLSSQLDSLQEELSSLQGGSPRNLLMCVSSDEQKQVELKDKEICELKKKKNDLKNQIQHLEMHISDLTMEVGELKSQNSELEGMLKDTREQLEAEQVQVTTLLEEVGSLTNYQKHLEEDFNEVQDMVQMKEKELATLQEETESQLRLEAEIDTLYQLLADQRAVEKELKQKVNELQKTLEETEQAHMVEADQWHLHLDEVTQKFIVEKENLEKQVKILRQNLTSPINSEDVYIQLIWRHISDAAETLNGQVELLEVFEQMVLHLLKQMVVFISAQQEEHHKTEIQTLNKNWQEKTHAEQEKYNGILREMASYKTRCQLYEEERQTLQSKHQDELQVTRSAMAQVFKEEQERLCADKDKYWQERLWQLEKSMKTDKESSEKLITAELQIQELSNKVEEVKRTLQEMHQKEITELKQALDKATKEKDTLSVEHRKELSRLENSMKSQHDKEKNNLIEEYKTKLLLVEEQLKSEFSSEKQDLERSYQQQILELQKTLNCRLEGEREHLQARHKEELSTLHNLFEKRWKDELEKLHELHQEELKQLKGCREETVEEIFERLFSIYENKLKNIQTECEQQIAHERQNNFASHQVELKNLQEALEEKFHDEKQKILESSENQMRVVKEELEKRYEKEMLEKLENPEVQLLSERIRTIEEDWQKKWENGRRKLQAAHQKEIASLRERYEFQLNKQRETLLRTHQEKMKQMEENYNQELQNARDILKELKAASLKDHRSDNLSSSRTQTPTSEVTTSSEQTSSSYTDAIPPHIKLLADEVHHEGLRVLSLTKNNRADQPLPFSDESIQWREERLWIVNRLKFITEVDERSDLKQVINSIVEELIHARVSYESLNTKEKKLQELIVQLQNQLRAQSSLFHEVQRKSSESVERSYEESPTQLRHQKASRQESKKSQNVTMANGDSYHNEFRRRSESHSAEDSSRRRGSTSSTPAEIERLRSGDISVSLEKFSTSVPEAASLLSPRFQKQNNSHFKFQECERCAYVEGVLVEERLRWIEEKAMLQESIQVMETKCSTMGNKMHLLANLKNKEPILASEAKLHRLYWKYRRSESYHKALIFQKKYLLNLLTGFQATEEVTLSILNRMGVTLSKQLELSSPSSTVSDSVHRGASLFRATAYAIISVVRMKFLAKRWQQAARVPPIHIITLEVDSAVKLPPTPKARPLSHSSSSSSKHSGTPSVENVSTDYRTRRRSYAVERSEPGPLAEVQSQLPGSEQLLEYVNRLAALHEQLGLSDLDKS